MVCNGYNCVLGDVGAGVGLGVGISQGHVDDLYGGYKAYNKLSSLGKGGKVLAEIGGKASNIAWLYGKVRTGYTILDIGIDVGKVGRSSSYIAERIFLRIWKSRNVWKSFYHLGG